MSQFLYKIALFGVAMLALVAGLMMVGGYDIQYSSGTSMKPALYDGSVVICQEGNSPEVGDIAVYEDEDGNNIVHRVVDVRRTGYVMKGDNQEMPDIWKGDSDDKTAPPERVHNVVFILHDGKGLMP